MEEIEVKYQVNESQEKIQDFIEKINLKFIRTEEQKDEYWDIDLKIINLKRGLRIRYDKGKLKSIQFKSLFKKKNKGFFIEEIDLLENGKINMAKLKKILCKRLNLIKESKFDNIKSKNPKEIFKEVGLKLAFSINKKREIYRNKEKGFSFEIDNIKGLPLYLEVEAESKDILERTCKIIEDNMNVKEVGNIGYLGLLFNSDKNIIREEEFQRRFNENPSWNILEGEKELYKKINEE